MTRSRLRDALATALANGKVTSRKEALRLLSRLSVPGAGEVLTAAWQEEGEHRDVRAAIVATARQRLHDPLSWPILESADARAELLAVLEMPTGTGWPVRTAAATPRWSPGRAASDDKRRRLPPGGSRGTGHSRRSTLAPASGGRGWRAGRPDGLARVMPALV